MARHPRNPVELHESLETRDEWEISIRGAGILPSATGGRMDLTGRGATGYRGDRPRQLRISHHQDWHVVRSLLYHLTRRRHGIVHTRGVT
jgi:hypothetical protein